MIWAISWTDFSWALSTVRFTVDVPSLSTAMNVPPLWDTLRAMTRAVASSGFSSRMLLAVWLNSSRSSVSGIRFQSEG